MSIDLGACPVFNSIPNKKNDRQIKWESRRREKPIAADFLA